MSKSRPESIIDPLDVIPKYGTDALRMALIMGVSPGNDQNWGWGKIEANRNFCNKLWNIARYIEGLVADDYRPGEAKPESVADHWVLSNLQRITEVVSDHLEYYRFGEAYDALYHFVWDDFADWYIEASKAQPNLPLLTYCLETILTLLHPFAPFVTETIWQTLGWAETSTEDGQGSVSVLASKPWPKIIGSDQKKAAEFAEVQRIVTESRFITKALGTSDTTLFYRDSDVLKANAELIRKLSRLKAVSEAPTDTTEGMRLTSTATICWLDIDAETAKKYLTTLDEKRQQQQQQIEQLEKRLANKSYVENAPEKVVAQTREQLTEVQQQLKNLDQERDRFAKL